MRVACPKCGKSVELPEGTDRAVCRHCQNRWTVPSAVVSAQERTVLTGQEPAGRAGVQGDGEAPAVQTICLKCGASVTIERGAGEGVCPECGEAVSTSRRTSGGPAGDPGVGGHPADGATRLSGRRDMSDKPTIASGPVAGEQPAGEKPAGEKPAAPGDAADRSIMDKQTVSSELADTVMLEDSGIAWLREHLSGRYEVLGFVSRGGMGAVYRVRQRHPSRVVALKVMLGGSFASERHRKRFEREAQAVAKLQHPGIVPIYEVGDVGGQPYFSMEFVEGHGLRDYVLLQRLDRRQICELMIHICEAVDYAHAQGVIHRDLKPGNIMVDGLGRGRILDFGLARIAREEEGATGSILTLSGDVMGTLRYMSPEQAMGKPKEIDGRTDVYSLGVILYELLVGVPPYNVDGVQGYQALDTVCTAEPVRPTLLQPDLSADLEAILLKTLEKQKADRYRTASALADDLRSYLEDKPVSARAATRVYRAQKFLWRNRRVVLPVLAGLVLLALVGTVLRVLWYTAARRAREAQEVAAAREETARNARQKVLGFVKSGKWELAALKANETEEEQPADLKRKHRLNGLQQLVIGLADQEATRRIEAIDELIHAQHYEDARQKATRLSAEAADMPCSDAGLKEAALARAGSFLEDCWKSVDQTFPAPYWSEPGGWFPDDSDSYRGARVYSKTQCEAFLDNYLALDDKAHDGEARELRDRVEAEGAEYFLKRRRAVARLFMADMAWEAALAALEGWGQAVEGAPEFSEEQKGQWREEFRTLEGEIGRTIRPANADQVEELRRIDVPGDFVPGVAFRPGGGELAYCGSDGMVRIVDIDPAAEVRQPFELPGKAIPRALAFSPDGKRLAVGAEDTTCHVYNLESAGRQTWASGHLSRLNGVAFSVDGRVLLTASGDAVKLWDVVMPNPRELLELSDAAWPAAVLRLAAGKGYVGEKAVRGVLAARTGELEVSVWELGFEHDPMRFDCDTAPMALAFSPDGRLLAAGCRGGWVRLWDWETAELLAEGKGHKRGVVALAFSPRGRLLATGGNDEKILLWDVTGVRRVEPADSESEGPNIPELPRLGKELRGHGSEVKNPQDTMGESWVNSLAFSPGGKLLASGGNDKTIRLWGISEEELPSNVP
ncbi:MAG: protein kinase [Candidatus Brocadiia bacterium]|nr:protein kinase [Candidatus Brocadiia bacterium]